MNRLPLRTPRYLFLVVVGVHLGGCASPSWFWNAPCDWALKKKLKSVPEDQPHGRLVLSRSDPHLLALVDDRVVFVSPEEKVASFRLAPGLHDLQARYREDNGLWTLTGRRTTTLDVSFGTKTTLRLEVRWTGIPGHSGDICVREE